MRLEDRFLHWMPTLLAGCVLVLAYVERGVNLRMMNETHQQHMRWATREESIQTALNGVARAMMALNEQQQEKRGPPERRKWTKPRWGSK